MKILKKALKLVFIFVLLNLLILSGTTLVFAKLIWDEVPDAEGLTERPLAQTSIIYDRAGQHVLYEIHGDINRKVLSHEEISDFVRFATIAAEDDEFYSHKGFDIKSIARAAKVNFETRSLKQGGSTITQQLARNALLTREKTFERKIKELFVAIKIEEVFTKDEILDMYLNEISYGSNIHGIQAAAEYYFGKNAANLTLGEAATLAALPNAPTLYSPHGDNLAALSKRREYILKRTALLGFTKQEEAEEALQEEIKVLPRKKEIRAPHFVFHVIEELKKTFGREVIEKGGLRIITTLDIEKQGHAEEVVRKGALENEDNYRAENAALVALDPKTGEVLVMAGSRDYFDKTIDGEVNVTTRLRQPGSAFKPIAYAKAFEKGFQPETLLYDVRTNFGPDGSGRNYIPRNYNNSFRGLVSMRDALAMSLNIPAVKTLYLASVRDTIGFAEKLGITTLTRKNEYGLSLVLGGGDITLLEGSSAYGVFANDGKRIPATAIKKVMTQDNKTLYEHQVEPLQVLDQQIARKINSILSDNKARVPVFGSQNKLFIPGKTVAAKTGTTQEYRDAWTIGYTPSVVVGVWAGNNDNTPMKPGAAGTFVAAPIWNEFMAYLLQDKPEESFADYQKVESDAFMISGKVEKTKSFYKKSSGEKISEEKAKKKKAKKVEVREESVARSLLYYVDKNDPMLKLWEAAIKGR